jgi:hypothetical protein
MKLGPGHPLVAQSLDNYAELLMRTGRADEARRAQVLAAAIRAKVAQANQAAPVAPGKPGRKAVMRVVVPG